MDKLIRVIRDIKPQFSQKAVTKGGHLPDIVFCLQLLINKKSILKH